MLNRPNSNKRRPQFLCIIGCEGQNQERMYFDKVAELVNCIEERTHDLVLIMLNHMEEILSVLWNVL